MFCVSLILANFSFLVDLGKGAGDDSTVSLNTLLRPKKDVFLFFLTCFVVGFFDGCCSLIFFLGVFTDELPLQVLSSIK